MIKVCRTKIRRKGSHSGGAGKVAGKRRWRLWGLAARRGREGRRHLWAAGITSKVVVKAPKTSLITPKKGNARLINQSRAAALSEGAATQQELVVRCACWLGVGSACSGDATLCRAASLSFAGLQASMALISAVGSALAQGQAPALARAKHPAARRRRRRPLTDRWAGGKAGASSRPRCARPPTSRP